MADPRRPKVPLVPGVSLPPPGGWRERELERELAESRAREAALRERPVPSMKPPASTPTGKPGSALPPWATALIAIATALAGVGGGQLARPAPPDPMPQLTAMREEIQEIRSDVKEVKEYQRREGRANAERWDISSGWMCRLNSKGPAERPRPFARGVDCDAVTWEAPPLGELVPWRASAEWPRTEKAP